MGSANKAMAERFRLAGAHCNPPSGCTVYRIFEGARTPPNFHHACIPQSTDSAGRFWGKNACPSTL